MSFPKVQAKSSIRKRYGTAVQARHRYPGYTLPRSLAKPLGAFSVLFSGI